MTDFQPYLHPEPTDDLDRHLETDAGAGRFAPSPSGALHLGNLRTALLGWLFARSTGRRYRLRMEDLDRVAPGAAQGQLRDLAALGIDFDGPAMWQSGRSAAYDLAIDSLVDAGRTYECFCTRREIREAASAPQADGGPAEGRYPGTCRDLTEQQRAQRQRTRPPALRLRAEVTSIGFDDLVRGHFTGPVDDLVLRRNDGLVAYNLAVVVDDAAQRIDQVVRGDDLLAVTPSQIHLAQLLGLPSVTYGHVQLALNPAGQRLAKRDGAVTLPDLQMSGWTPRDVFRLMAGSLGLSGDTPAGLLDQFEPARLPRSPWIVDPPSTNS